MAQSKDKQEQSQLQRTRTLLGIVNQNGDKKEMTSMIDTLSNVDKETKTEESKSKSNDTTQYSK